MNTNENSIDKVLSMDELSAQDQFPQVNHNAIEAVNAANAEKQAEAERLEAAKNPGKLRLKKDGTPAAKRGRKPNSEKPPSSHNSTAPKLNMPGEQTQNPSQKAVVEIPSIVAAQMISGTIENAQVSLLSKDFRLNEIERSTNIEAWRLVIESQGGIALSPVQALLMSHGQIILTRFATSKETQGKFALAKVWMKSKIQKWKNRNAYSDFGKNIKREDDIRKKEDSKSEKTAQQTVDSPRPVS